MKTPVLTPMTLVDISTKFKFYIEEDKIFTLGSDLLPLKLPIYIGHIYKYTRKGFYYIDLFGNKSYITWSNFDDVNKKDDDNLPNQLPHLS